MSTDTLALPQFQSAVRAECEACVAAKQAPDIPTAIRECTVALCPLRLVRPYQRTSRAAYG